MSAVQGKKSRRIWLNPIDSDDNGWMRWNHESIHGATLVIADCSRSIALNFQHWGSDEAKGRLKKLDAFESAVRQFCAYGRAQILREHPELQSKE